MRFKRRRVLIATVLIIVDIVLNTVIAIRFPGWFGMVNLALGRVPVFIAGCFLAPKVKAGDSSKRIGFLALAGVCVVTFVL